MSIFPDLTPLVNQLKEYNLNQVLMLQELKEIKNLLKENATITKNPVLKDK
jgi:hypothetical protein